MMLKEKSALAALLWIAVLPGARESICAPAADEQEVLSESLYGHQAYEDAPTKRLRPVGGYEKVRLLPAAATAVEEMQREAEVSGVQNKFTFQIED